MLRDVNKLCSLLLMDAKVHALCTLMADGALSGSPTAVIASGLGKLALVTVRDAE